MRKQLIWLFFAGVLSAQYIPPGGGGGGAPTGAAGGSLAGTYPNPSLATLAQDLLFTDATYDMGKLGATRPRDGFFSRNLNVGSTATIGNTVVLDGTTNGITTASKIGGALLSGLTGPVKFTAGVPSIALAADITGLFSGTCPTGATCVTGTDGTKQTVSAFPYSYQRGTPLGFGMSLSSASFVITFPFSNSFNPTTACNTTGAGFYFQMPMGGFIRNLAGTTGIANATSGIRWGMSPSCVSTTASIGGPVTKPGAAAGGTVDTSPASWIRLNQWNPLGLGFLRQGATSTAAPISETAEFISDDGLQATLLGNAYVFTLGASSTQYLGWASPVSSTEANISLPIPIAGTFKNLFIATTVQPANTVAVTFRKNLAATALVTTIGTTDTGGTYIDDTHTVSVVAGDNVDIETVSGASTQAAYQASGVAFVPSVAGDTFVWGAFNAGTVTTTNKYALPFSPLTGTAIASFEATMPFACAMSNLYAYQASANGGSTVTTLTLMKNGVATALTGTIGVGVTGSVLIDGTHSVAYSQGDLITIQYITNTGTSGTMSAWSAKCS